MVEGTLYGPLHNPEAVQKYVETIEEAEAQGGKIVYGGKVMLNLFIIMLYNDSILSKF